MSKKRGQKRRKTKYPGLETSVNSKLRHEYIDQDYIDQLTEEEKQWLSNFNEEYLSGNFKHRGELLNKTKQEQRECYHRNNARNRCLLSIKKATGYLQDMENTGASQLEVSTTPTTSEDVLIDLLDNTKSEEPSENPNDDSDTSK